MNLTRRGFIGALIAASSCMAVLMPKRQEAVIKPDKSGNGRYLRLSIDVANGSDATAFVQVMNSPSGPIIQQIALRDGIPDKATAGYLKELTFKIKDLRPNGTKDTVSA